MAEQLKSTVKTYCEGENRIFNLCFVMRDENDSKTFSLRRVEIRNDDDTAKNLMGLFTDFLLERIVNEDDLQILSMEAEEHIGAVYQYTEEDYPEELGYFMKFPPLIQIPRFNAERDNLSRLVGYIIEIQNDNEKRILLYKKHYAFSVIRKERTVLAFRKVSEEEKCVRSEERKKKPREGIVSKIEESIKSKVDVVGNILFPDEELYKLSTETDMIQLNGTVHIVKENGNVYILDPRAFEQMLGTKENLDRDANDAITAIAALGVLESVGMIGTMGKRTEQTIDGETTYTWNNPRFARKLHRIWSNSVVCQKIKSKALDAGTIVAFAEKEPYKEQFTFAMDDENKKRIKLDSKKSVEAFLNLLNDSYLHSELTGANYASGAKVRLEMPAPTNKR